MDKEQINALLAQHGIAIKSAFVPFSQSRNKAEKNPSLNWTVTLVYKGRDVLTTDYGAGCAHCPSYKNPPKLPNGRVDNYVKNRIIAEECETGWPQVSLNYGGIYRRKGAPAIMPDACDVLHSLILDSSVLDAGGFESWASDFGYDTDSRAAEKIYKACLEIALKLRASFGDALMSELREAFSDY